MPETPPADKTPSAPEQAPGNPRKAAAKSVTGSGGNKPHGSPARNRQGLDCGQCQRVGRKCHWHGGRSTGPKSSEGKRVVRQNAEKHGLYSDPLVFLDNMPLEAREAFEALVAAVAKEEGVSKNPADLIVVRDLVLADLIAQRGLEYLLKEWTTKYRDDGKPYIAEGEALQQWAGYARLKAQLRAALRQGTGERGDPGKASGVVTLEDLRAARKSIPAKKAPVDGDA